jgi:hypothetical protein
LLDILAFVKVSNFTFTKKYVETAERSDDASTYCKKIACASNECKNLILHRKFQNLSKRKHMCGV